MTKESETHDTASVAAGVGASVAPEKAAAKKAGGRKKVAPRAAKTAARAKSKKPGKPGKKAARKNDPRGKSKGMMILEMIGRAKGATLAEIMTATGWQAHSVRGFISTTSKKDGLGIESTKNDSGARVYRLME